MFGRKLLKSWPCDVFGDNITRFRYLTGHGSELIFAYPQWSRQILCWHKFRVNTQMHSNVRREEELTAAPHA